MVIKTKWSVKKTEFYFVANYPFITSHSFAFRKLALFDDWNSLAVYVSMDNTVVIEDISKCFFSD